MKKTLLSFMFILTVSSILLGQNTFADGLITHSDIFNTSMEPGVTCYRIPSIVTAKNGDLIAAIDERVANANDLNKNEDINIVIRRSKDNGKTWGKIETVVDFPLGYSASDPSMIVNEDTGEICMFYNYMDVIKEQHVYYFHVVKSGDNGETWSKPVDITDQIAIPGSREHFKFITSGRGIYTRDGKMLHTLVNVTDKQLNVFGSDDHGKSWYVLETPIKPADESKIVELSDGRWMISSRVNEKTMRYTHISSDKGKSWVTRPEPTLIDPSCNGSIIRYTAKVDGDDKDRLIFSNLYSATKDRKDLCVRISYDEGETWSSPKFICLGSAAYSSLTLLNNGDIAIFFERDCYKANEVAVFSLEWLTDGKDGYVKPIVDNAKK